MNTPRMGLTADDPGKFVLGSVPVETDGSAYFQVPSGVNLFFQALDGDGVAVQTMRTVTYVQPGQTLSCVGCHEHRHTSPANLTAAASRRAPSRLTPGPEGTWPFRFDQLVGGVVETRCATCHRPGAENANAARLNLAGEASYETLVGYGRPSLRDQVRKRYFEGRSAVNESGARSSALLAYLDGDRLHQPLLTAPERQRLILWLDLYGQRLGSFSARQERELAALRVKLSSMIDGKGRE